MAFRKPCIECGVVSRGTRCPDHQRTYDEIAQKKRDNNPERIARKKLLYNSTYRKQAQWIRNTATTCHLCGIPFQPGDAIEADHVEAGNPNSQLLAAHRRCNASRGNKPTFE